MESHRVTFRPGAEQDLLELYDFIAGQEGPAIAAGYIDRIESACMGLALFPLRGRARDDIRRGLRTLGFERRATIVYSVSKREVTIVRVFCGGRHYQSILGSKDDD